jgi:hypothetical protein
MPLGNNRVSVYYLQSLFCRNNQGAGAKVATIEKRIMQSTALLALVGLIVAVSGCGNQATLGTVTAVSITSASNTVQINEQTQITAAVTVAGQNDTTIGTTPITASTTPTWFVNGVSGGNPTYGTIQADPSDLQVGIYTAPTKVPSVNGGVLTIYATVPRNPNGTSSGGANLPVQSNTINITISPGLGLQIITPPSTVPAGGSAQFIAQLNGVSDPNATWAISSKSSGDIGTINANSGIYNAPTYPPPGDSVTITASDSGVTASTTVSITYSDQVMAGSFAFSYTGNDSQGFLAAAGSFKTDGNGDITSGVEDLSSFLTGVTTTTPIQIKNTSRYVIGVDGRGTATLDTSIGTQTLAFVLTTNQHAIITRFDSSATGSGTMDEQNINDIGGSASVISGSYVFSAMGTDASFNPEAVGGEFSANGGTISAANSLIDIHDGATSSASITTATNLSADSSYSFDQSNLGSGRGTLTLNVGGKALNFAFYIVDSTQLYMVEIDGKNAYLAGNIFSAANTAPGLASASYVFTAGGSAAPGANGSSYAIGGIFAANGSGGVTSGTVDVNNKGTVASGTALSSSCSYTVDPTTGRIDLKLCGSGTGATTSEFAMYPFQTTETTQAQNFVLIEIDSNALTTGVSYEQSSTSAPTAGGFALGLVGQGIYHGSRPSTQNIDGHFSGSSGALDINFFGPNQSDPIGSAVLGSSGTTSGRGTLVLTAKSPSATYNLIYYTVSGNEALLLDGDANSSLVMTGLMQGQY